MKSEIKECQVKQQILVISSEDCQFCFVLKPYKGCSLWKCGIRTEEGNFPHLKASLIAPIESFDPVPGAFVQSGHHPSTILLDQETSQEDFIKRSRTKIFWSPFRGTELQPPVPDNTNYHFVHPANLLRQHPTPGLPVSSFFPDLLPSLLSLISKWIKVMKWQLTQRQLCSQ